MPQRSDAQDLVLEAADGSEFDPLQDFSFDDDEQDDEYVKSTLEEGPFGMPDPGAVPQFQRNLSSFDDAKSAEERIEALFAQMPTLQHMLFAILKECESPVRDVHLEAIIEDMKRQHHSVYSPATFATLLERAGAIMKTDADGTLLGAVEQEPNMVVVDGAEFWKVAAAPDVYWTLTQAGRAKLASYKPVDAIKRCFEEEPQYTDVFLTALRMSGAEGGTTVKAIGDIVDDEPVLQKPRRFAMYFIDKLEHAGGVEWKGAWVITNAGREFLRERAENEPEA